MRRKRSPRDPLEKLVLPGAAHVVEHRDELLELFSRRGVIGQAKGQRLLARHAVEGEHRLVHGHEPAGEIVDEDRLMRAVEDRAEVLLGGAQIFEALLELWIVAFA